MYSNPMTIRLSYSHKPIEENLFIFPITGFKVGLNKLVSIGNIDFVDKEYLIKNVIDSELKDIGDFKKYFNDVRTFAIVDLRNYGYCNRLCKDGNNSLALQVLKQTIGAIYLSLFIKRDSVDFERRIVISNKNIHEVDEGLNPYLADYQNMYMIVPNNVAELLNGDIFDIDLKNIKNVIEILSKEFKQKNDYEKRICKSLEILYSIYNESYSRERIIKWSILLNYIFRESDNESLDSNDIGRKLRIIFTIIENREILERIPKYISPKGKKTKKISGVMVDVYSRVRNDLMHGKIDFYTEYAVCNLEDMIILKIIVLEVLIFMTKDEYYKRFTSIKEFKEFIEEKEKVFVDEKKAKKSKK